MEEREQKGSGVGCVVFGALLVMLPVLYVLGFGPAVLLAKHNPSTEPWLITIYIPLIALSEICTPVDWALTWYTELWGG